MIENEIERGEYKPWRTSKNDILAGFFFLLGMALLIVALVAFQ